MLRTHSLAKISATLVAAALAVVIAPLSATAATPAPARVTFGIQPASGSKPDGRPDFTFGTTPGAALTDHVAIVNYSTTPLTLQVYATDALTTTSGSFGLPTVNTVPKAVGKWITLGERTVHVPAKTSKSAGFVILPFRVIVPLSASPGDNAGGIVASLQTTGRNSTGQDVVLNQRVGTRVFLRVAGTLTPKLTVSGFQAKYHGTINPFGRGSITATFDVHNVGNVAVGYTPVLSSSGLFGGSNKRSGAQVALILPGSTVHEKVTVERVWPQFLADLKVKLAPFAEAGAVDPSLAKASASVSGSTSTVPWPLIILVVLVVGEYTRRKIMHRNRSPITRTPHARQHGQKRGRS